MSPVAIPDRVANADNTSLALLVSKRETKIYFFFRNTIFLKILYTELFYEAIM